MRKNYSAPHSTIIVFAAESQMMAESFPHSSDEHVKDESYVLSQDQTWESNQWEASEN